MSESPILTRIGVAQDAQEVADWLHKKVEDGQVEEVLVVISHRDKETGAMNWSYRRTRLRSKFALIGVNHWIANDVIQDGQS